MAITLGGGGGSASQINEVVSLQDTADIVTLADGRVYLKGGIYETDLTVYPNADSTFYYASESFSVSSQDTAPYDITWDGTYFWVLGGTNKTVYKYNASGTYQNVSFSVASQDASPQGITWDGSHLWVTGDNSDTVYKYNTSGTYQNVSFSSQSNYAQGIVWNGSHFWTVDRISDAAFKYTAAGVYTGTSFALNGQEVNSMGITWDGSHLWVVGYTADTVFKYEPRIGVASDTSFGAQNYVRVA